MKQQKMKRIISGLLAFVMVALMIPFGTIIATALDDTNFTDDPTRMLGVGFNALGDKELGVSGLIVGAQWIDLENQATKVYTFGNSDGTGVLEQKGEATYSQSSVEFMESLGVNVSSSVNASFPMLFMKANIGVKLGSSFNLSTTTTADEHYYHYTYQAITNRYVLGNDYSNYLSKEFLNKIDELNYKIGKGGLTEDAKLELASFFGKYGTHMLTAFETGGEINLTAWAYSTTFDQTSKEEISSEIKGGVGVGDKESVEVSITTGMTMESKAHEAGYESATTYYAVGGEAAFVGTGQSPTATMDEAAIAAWVNSLAGKSVFIPSTSEWLPMWEVLPVDASGSYENLRQLMYQYFVEATRDKNLGTLTRYCSFSNRIELNGYTYISGKNDYVYQNVPFAKDDKNYVAPGSSIVIAKDVDTTLYDMSDLSYEIDVASAAYATVDRNGTIRIRDDAEVDKTVLLKFKYGDYVVLSVTFVVAPEPDKFGGGYGTESRPYLISTKEHLKGVAGNSNMHFMLTNDINFGGEAFDIPEFSGVLDGNGHRIYGFYCSYGTDSELTNLGFIRKNTGVVRNLIIGNAAYAPVDNENFTALQGLNKATGEVAQQFSVSIKSVQNEESISKNRISVGALIGWNEGVVDNCRVENVYVYAQIKDQNDDDTSYAYVGMIGTNQGGGVVVRSVATKNYFEAYATAKEDSGDDCYAYVGGICGRNGGIVDYCISYQNDLRSDARGNGKGDNKAYPAAIAGGIVGRVSNVHEEKKPETFWQLENSVAYDNLFSVYYSKVGATDGKGYLGTIAGQVMANSTESARALNACYTDSKSNGHATCETYDLKTLKLNPVGSLENVDTGVGYYVESTREGLMAQANGFEHFALITENGKETIAVPQPSTLNAVGGREDYIVGDYLDPKDIVISADYKDDNVTKAFKVYRDGQFNENGVFEGQFEPAAFTVFKIDGFATEDPSAGVATKITVPYATGLASGAYQPTVSDEAVEELLIEQLPYITDYYVGDALDLTGLTLTKKYNTGAREPLTEGYTVSGYDANAVGAQLITVSYIPDPKDEAHIVSATYTVTVHLVKPAAITVLSLPEKSNYAVGESFNKDGLSVTLIYNNGSIEVLDADAVACTGFESSSEGNKDITVAYTYYDEELGKDCTLTDVFSVNVGTIDSIEIETLPTKLSYYTSDKKVNAEGLSIKVTYTNGVSKTVSSDKAIQLEGYNLSVVGTQNVTVVYQGFKTTYEIEVLPVTLASIAVKTLPKTEFYVSDQFTASGLALTLTYVDGTTRDVYEGFAVTVNGYDEGVTPKFFITDSKTVTVAFEEDGIRRTTSYGIRISERMMQSILVVQAPLKQLYKANEPIDTTDMLIYGVFNNGDVVEIKDYVVRTPDLSTAGKKTVRVSYMGTYETEFGITVLAPERIYVAQMPTKETYVIGEAFDPAGLVIKAVYWDYSEVILPEGDYMLSEPVFDELGGQMVEVTFGDLQTYFYVQVKEFEVPEDAPKIVIDSTNGTIGKTVTVKISLKNNPGIASMKLNVTFDQSVLTLADITYNSEMGGQFQLPQDMDSPAILNWYNGWNNCEDDGAFATLTFTVAEDATHDSYTNISVTYDPEDVYNILEQNVTFYAEGGDLHVIEYVPGDINNDGEVNNKDVTRMFQYLSGWEVEVCEKALDVNGDGNVNNKDMTRLFQYLSDWDVEIY